MESLNSSIIIYKKENNNTNELESLNSSVVIPQIENNKSLDELNSLNSDKDVHSEDNNLSRTGLKINFYKAFLFLFV